MKTTVEQLAQAQDNIGHRTPLEVLEAFCPIGTKIAGVPLVPLTAGHELFLSRIKHPIQKQGNPQWEAHDVAMALFCFTRPSSELARYIESDTYEAKFYEFLDGLPVGEIEHAVSALIAHYAKSRITVVQMESIDTGKAKKKAGWVGSLKRFFSWLGNIICRPFKSFTPCP